MGKVGIEKYPSYISRTEYESENYNRFYQCPRNISSRENEFNSLDVTVIVLCLRYGSVFGDKIKTPPLSLDLISKLTFNSTSKGNKTKIQNSLTKIVEKNVLEVNYMDENLFEISCVLTNGFFKMYHSDIDKIMQMGLSPNMLHKTIHVMTYDASMIFSSSKRESDNSKFITYRSYKSLGEMCDLRRQTIAQIIDILEINEIVATYRVILEDANSYHKTVRARYRDRDRLRLYVEERLNDTYKCVISKKEKVDE